MGPVGSAIEIEKVEARDTAYILQCPQQPQTQDYSSQNVNSAEGEKPSCRLRGHLEHGRVWELGLFMSLGLSLSACDVMIS